MHGIIILLTLIQQLSIPEVAKHIHLYPELGHAPVREFWEADKLREVDHELLSPMYARGLQHFYVNELAQLCNATYVIPLRWITVDGVVHGECVVVNTVGSDVSLMIGYSIFMNC